MRVKAQLRYNLVRGMCSAFRCTCGECGAPAFFVWNGKTAWKKLLQISGIKDLKDIKCGLQTIKPKASTLEAFEKGSHPWMGAGDIPLHLLWMPEDVTSSSLQ